MSNNITQLSIANFPTWDGNPATYLIFRSSLFTCLKNCSRFDPQGLGLLGEIEEPAAFLARPRRAGIVAAPYVARPHPGDRPVLPPNSIPAVVATHNDLVNMWKEDNIDHNGEQYLLDQAKHLLCKAVPDHCIAALKDPVEDYNNVLIMRIRRYLDLQFLILPPAIITANLALLEVPYSPSNSLAEYVGSIREIARILAANNCAIADTRLFLYLLHGVTPCGIFEMSIIYYRAERPNAVRQTFETFAATIIEFDRNRGPSTTAKAAGYVAAVASSTNSSSIVSTVHPDPVVAAIISSLNTANAAIAGIQSILQSQQNPRGGKILKVAGGGGGAGKLNPLYCWTHGAMTHPSHACLHKLINHQDGATYHNQMGGKKA